MYRLKQKNILGETIGKTKGELIQLGIQPFDISLVPSKNFTG